MTNFTFNVENDQGDIVEKTATVAWVKDRIKQDLQVQGYNTTFRVRQTSDNTIEAYNTKGNVIEYCYGGFDECEVIEPCNHGDWPKRPRKDDPLTKLFRKHNITSFKRQLDLYAELPKCTARIAEFNIGTAPLDKLIKSQKPNSFERDFYMLVRKQVKNNLALQPA
jgi:hypothetical protein